MIQARAGTRLDESLRMRTIQVSIGELIEAVYEELIETYGDRELALVAAQAVGDDLLERLVPATPPRTGN
jgi:hypothetical protein